MATTPIASESKLAIGINVFTIKPENEKELIETLTAINREILAHKYPMIVSANFHRAIDAPVVVNYNQYTDRARGQFLRTQENTAPLMKRTHDLSETHEIRWYEVADVVAAGAAADRIEIAAGRLGVIGTFTVDPGKQGEFLALATHYGETLKTARAEGFLGIATHRGYQEAHAASYEQWSSADAYRQAIRQGPAADALNRMRDAASAADIHLYDVVSVTRFDLNW